MEVVKTGKQFQGSDSQVVPRVSSPRVGSANINERWESESLRAIALYNTGTCENRKEAEAILFRLANEGHGPSKIAMGDIYENKSFHWVSKCYDGDYDEAINWYKEMAQESVLACYKLGKMYLRKCPELAWQTFCQGLELNNEEERDACCKIHTQMGKICLEGVYVERDVYQAEKHFISAMDGDSTTAADARWRLGSIYASRYSRSSIGLKKSALDKNGQHNAFGIDKDAYAKVKEYLPFKDAMSLSMVSVANHIRHCDDLEFWKSSLKRDALLQHLKVPDLRSHDKYFDYRSCFLETSTIYLRLETLLPYGIAGDGYVNDQLFVEARRNCTFLSGQKGDAYFKRENGKQRLASLVKQEIEDGKVTLAKATTEINRLVPLLRTQEELNFGFSPYSLNPNPNFYYDMAISVFELYYQGLMNLEQVKTFIQQLNDKGRHHFDDIYIFQAKPFRKSVNAKSHTVKQFTELSATAKQALYNSWVGKLFDKKAISMAHFFQLSEMGYKKLIDQEFQTFFDALCEYLLDQITISPTSDYFGDLFVNQS